MTRFCSSGMDRSNERSPASTWARGMPFFAAVSAPARVVVVSPYTSTASGRSSRSTCSKRSIMMASWCTGVPGPTSSA